ncbi:ECF-type sigma factor [Schlesneria sp.]|uniref:ECF-type sigma factor n=1 Tax=Schlesneria sp. TaxID=2762018 RepID=UPI002EEB03F5
MSEITAVLDEMRTGDADASARLLPLVYAELRRIAAFRMSHEKCGNTLQPTALVHEAWLRMATSPSGNQWENRQHFYAAAAESMRRILVDAARRKAAQKHGGKFSRLQLSEDELLCPSPAAEIVAVNDALDQLEEDDSVAAELVKLHYFGGLSLEEAGEMLNLSRASAYRVWTYAKTFLRVHLTD